jgi:hypothetical protein
MRGEAVQLRVKHETLEVVVTVPVTVREWFVEATDVATGTRTEDWCDYDGYDSSSPERLDQDMAEDVSHFVHRLLGSELKLELGRRSRLLWKVSDTWQQAVPLDASAV